jgi:hypothetical protein
LSKVKDVSDGGIQTMMIYFINWRYCAAGYKECEAIITHPASLFEGHGLLELRFHVAVEDYAGFLFDHAHLLLQISSAAIRGVREPVLRHRFLPHERAW